MKLLRPVNERWRFESAPWNSNHLHFEIHANYVNHELLETQKDCVNQLCLEIHYWYVNHYTYETQRSIVFIYLDRKLYIPHTTYIYLMTISKKQCNYTFRVGTMPTDRHNVAWEWLLDCFCCLFFKVLSLQVTETIFIVTVASMVNARDL